MPYVSKKAIYIGGMICPIPMPHINWALSFYVKPTKRSILLGSAHMSSGVQKPKARICAI